MRKRDDSKKLAILEYIDEYYSDYGQTPTVRAISKGESMINAGIRHGNYVVIRKQSTANIGDYVVALYNGLNNLKKLAHKDGKYLLRSCNDDKDSYPDIHVNNLQVQGVAVCVMHSLIKK